MGRKRTAVVVSAALVGVAGAAGWAVVGNHADGTKPPADVPTGTAAVVRTDVAERQQINGTLGHSGTYDLLAPAQGTLTWLPAVGTVVGRGQRAYEVNGVPVLLLFGARPAWRAYHTGMTDGADVQQLEVNLRALGYGDGVTVDRHFSAATATAIRYWQKARHVAQTGSIDLGQIVYLPQSLRVAGASLEAGAQVQPGATVLHGTSDEPAVTSQINPTQFPSVKAGDPVVVTFPDGSAKKGKIVQVGAVVVPSAGGSASGTGGSGSSSQPTATLTIKVEGNVRQFLDQSQVQVAVTTQAHKGVLAVPITALRAQAGGSYQVIVQDGSTTHGVTVHTGLFDEVTGLAEVSGGGLAAGNQVEVPDESS